MIYVVATTQVKPESRDAFIKGAKGMHRGDPQGKRLHFL